MPRLRALFPRDVGVTGAVKRGVSWIPDRLRCLACAVVLAASFGAASARGDEPRVPDTSDADAAEEHEENQALRGELGEWASWEADRSGPGPGVWTIEWRDGLRIGRRDGTTGLLVGGELMLDGGVFYGDSGVRPGRSGWDAKGEMRRARLFVQGLVLENFFFKLAYDVPDEELKDAYLGLRDLGPIRTLALGQLKEPFSLENETSLRNQPFLERSLASALAPGRNLGLLASGVLFDARLRWAFGAFVTDDSRRQEDESVRGYDEDPELALRVSGLPIWRDEGRTLLLLGASFTHTFVDRDEELELSARPETELLKPLFTTGRFHGVTSIERLGVEVAAVRGPFWLQADWIANRFQRDTGDLDFWGGSVRAGWFLTGERRRYGRASGVFGRVVPRKPFSWSERRFGALEVAGRVSYLDITDRDVRGGRQLDLTVGLNWYLRAHLRVGLNWVHAHVHGRGDIDVVQARLQIDI